MQQIGGNPRLFLETAMKKPALHSDAKIRRAFAKRLRASRVVAGFETQRAMAEEAGIEAETYRRYERGETEPGLGTLVRISLALRQSLDVLVFGQQSPLSPLPGQAAESKKASQAAE